MAAHDHASETKKAPLSIHITENSLTWLVVGLCAALIAGSLVWGWKALQITPERLTEAKESGATATPTPKAPILELNTPHQRQGQIIEVDPSEIGKANPFQ